MTVLRPRIFPKNEVLAALSVRDGSLPEDPFGMNLSFNVGDNPETVRRNRASFFGGLGINEDELAIPRQVHGTTIRRIDRPGSYPNTDGLITASTGIFLCVTFADCVPILLFDPEKKCIGAVHAGWRGAAGEIVALGIRALAQDFDTKPRDVLAYVGPAAGACCYEIGDEVARRFDERFVHRDSGTTVDLKGVLVDQLLNEGCMRGNIETSSACTIHELQYHSYRRDGPKSGRMMACIALLRAE